MIYSEVKDAYNEIYNQPIGQIESIVPDENTFESTEYIEKEGHPKPVHFEGISGNVATWYGDVITNGINNYMSFFSYRTTGSGRTTYGFRDLNNDGFGHIRIEASGQINLQYKSVGGNAILITNIGTSNFDEWEHYIIMARNRADISAVAFEIYQNDSLIYNVNVNCLWANIQFDFRVGAVADVDIFLDRIYIGLDFDTAKSIEVTAIPFRNGDDEIDTFYDDAIYYRTIKPTLKQVGTGLLDEISERAGITITAIEREDLNQYIEDFIKLIQLPVEGKQWHITNKNKVVLYDDIYQKTLILRELQLR